MRRGRGRCLWASTGMRRGSGQTMLRGGIVEWVVLLIISATRWLLVWRGRRRASWCVQGSPSIPRRLAWRRRRSTPRSSGRDGWRLSGFQRAPWRLKRVVIGHGTFIKAGVTLMGLQSVLELSPRRDISVVVSIVFGHFPFDTFTSLPGSRRSAYTTIRSGTSADLAWRWRGRGATLRRRRRWV